MGTRLLAVTDDVDSRVNYKVYNLRIQYDVIAVITDLTVFENVYVFSLKISF